MNNTHELNDTLPMALEIIVDKIPKVMALKRRHSTRKISPKARQRKSFTRPMVSKRVSFETEENGDVKRETCELPHQRVLSDEEKADCWWSNDECTNTKMEAIAKQIQASDSVQYTTSCRELLIRCTTRASASASYMDSLLETIIDSEARGLEFDTIKLLQHRQKRAIRTVMVSQERMRDIDDWKQRAHMIALQYRRSSVYASEWARWVATGDARVVSKL